ncbi:D-Ala-D-Ala carboxypeptidase family metallohydrolase [Xylanibacter brevis]|uniref:D-Ala-D-Ala carboxypeptidase family metallohydrolase n=1 Tax=Xylanibacter brevis TaxID=83231 RepID=UPI0004879011|nr:D-Ala-D-Ala carboxypeptidase family metallohydrolase [Xylanibacter brevis]
MRTQTQLTEHFTLQEMMASGTAIRLGLKNEPGEKEVEALRHLCEEVLEPLRQRFGRIIIASGYRCEALNKAVGGVKNSQHMRGEAADIHCGSQQTAQRYYLFISKHLVFDQLLLERRLSNGCCWIHVSYIFQPGRRANRQMVKELTV